MMLAVSILTMNTQTFKYKSRLMGLQAIIGFSTIIVAFQFYFLMEIESETAAPFIIMTFVSFFVGVIFCRVILLIYLLRVTDVTHTKGQLAKQVATAVFLPMSFGYFEMMTFHIKLFEQDDVTKDDVKKDKKAEQDDVTNDKKILTLEQAYAEYNDSSVIGQHPLPQVHFKQNFVSQLFEMQK